MKDSKANEKADMRISDLLKLRQMSENNQAAQKEKEVSYVEYIRGT